MLWRFGRGKARVGLSATGIGMGFFGIRRPPFLVGSVRREDEICKQGLEAAEFRLYFGHQRAEGWNM